MFSSQELRKVFECALHLVLECIPVGVGSELD